jgi:hypothetical protein
MVTAVIAYDKKCITKGSDKFCDYPLIDYDEGQINNYKMANLTDDHKLYTFHLGRVKKVNDLKEMKHKREEVEKIAATSNVFDIECKLSDGVDPYLILIGEFRSTGPLSVHTIQKGDKRERLARKRHGIMYIWVTSLCGIMPLTRVNLQKTNLGKFPGKFQRNQ